MSRATLKIELATATRADEPVLQNLMQLYAYDLSDVAGLHVGDDGLFELPSLAAYWSETSRFAFLIKVSDELAGFALVARGSRISDDPDVWDVAEFFVLKSYRRHGVGAAVAHEIWRRIVGRWEVRVLATNGPAQRFWQTTIDELTGAAIAPVTVEQGGRQRLVFAFESRAMSHA
jgi:predicted acetyltransferase